MSEQAASPHVTVVIPTKERPEGLVQVLNDLAVQHSPPVFEVVAIVDGSDPRKYQQLVEQMDVRFPVRLLVTTGIGPAGARNVGIRASNAPVIAFCEDDVRLDKNWLSRGVLPLQADLADVVDGEVLSVQGTLRRGEGSRRTIPAYLPCSLFVKRSLVEAVDGFDEGYFQDGLYFREDSDFGFRLEAAGARVLIEQGAIVWHPLQFFSGKDIDRHLRRYRMDARLYRQWPDRYRASIERKRIGPVSIRRPLHLAALAWAIGCALTAIGVGVRRPGVVAASLTLCATCGLAFRARYVSPPWRGLWRMRELMHALSMPYKHLAALYTGSRRFGGWGVFVP